MLSCFPLFQYHLDNWSNLSHSFSGSNATYQCNPWDGMVSAVSPVSVSLYPYSPVLLFLSVYDSSSIPKGCYHPYIYSLDFIPFHPATPILTFGNSLFSAVISFPSPWFHWTLIFQGTYSLPFQFFFTISLIGNSLFGIVSIWYWLSTTGFGISASPFTN